MLQNVQMNETLIVMLLVIGVLLVGATLAYLKLMKKYYSLRVDYKRIRAGVRKKAEKLEERAYARSRDIVEAAHDSAERIVNAAEIFGEKEQKVMDSEIAGSVKGLSDNIKAVAKLEIEEFRKAMQRSTVEVQAETKARVQEAEQRVNRELAAYKLEREAEISREIQKIVKDTILRVTGKVISTDDHKDLVIKALEEAKKRNV